MLLAATAIFTLDGALPPPMGVGGWNSDNVPPLMLILALAANGTAVAVAGEAAKVPPPAMFRVLKVFVPLTNRVPSPVLVNWLLPVVPAMTPLTPKVCPEATS